MKAQQIIITLVVAIVVGAAAFYGGMQYQKSKTSTSQGANGAASRTGRTGGQGRFGQNGGGATRGQVVSMDSNSITVKLQDGSSKIVLINGSTQIGKSQKAAQSDIQKGDTVVAIGSANSDGSITAQDIQINPQGNFGRTGASPSPAQ